MFYKPTYCCSCGDKIERIEWRLLASRRFCDLCETEYQLEEWLPRIAGAVVLIFGVWGVGSYFSSSADSIDISNPRAFARSRFDDKNQGNSAARRQKSKADIARREQSLGLSEIKPEDRNRKAEIESPVKSETVSQPVAKRIKRKQIIREESKPSYFCGAETKKGTPCSRKVKGKKRCWQHEGRKAMLPQNELAVGGNR